jgi:hypothetical protein
VKKDNAGSASAGVGLLDGAHDYYAEGVEAAHSYKTAAHCPYTYGSVEADLWLQGYQDAGGRD